MADDRKVQKLVDRLRALEAESLQLANMDLDQSLHASRDIYERRLQRLAAAHSRSWFGEHSTTYYGDFEPPPGGRSFDVEWGFILGFDGSRNPGWQVYSRDEIRNFVFGEIGEVIFYKMNELSGQIVEQFSVLRDQATDVLEILSTTIETKGVRRYATVVENEIKLYTTIDYVNGGLSQSPNMTRDSEQIAKGRISPLHFQYQGAFDVIDANKRRLRELAATLRKTIEAVLLMREMDMPTNASKSKTVVFIGHGRSEQWRVLKDFLTERLHLEFEEFNRVSPAGLSTKERLDEMLNKCDFAFLIFTAEDVRDDGQLHARENVIHEAGLFQGRLGWRRAIIVLEEQCEEFSNILGLGQIRFARANISSCFEEIRRVLEREQLVASIAH